MEGSGPLLLSCLSLLISCLFYHSLSHKTNNTEHVCYENESLSLLPPPPRSPLSVALFSFHSLSPSFTKAFTQNYILEHPFFLLPPLCPVILSCPLFFSLCPGFVRRYCKRPDLFLANILLQHPERRLQSANFSHVHAFSFSAPVDSLHFP